MGLGRKCSLVPVVTSSTQERTLSDGANVSSSKVSEKSVSDLESFIIYNKKVLCSLCVILP